MIARSPYMHEFNIIEAPCQYVKKAIYTVCEGAAFHTIAFNRKTFNGQRHIDRSISLSLINHEPEIPKQAEDIAQIHNENARNRATRRSQRHQANLEAAGPPTNYQHDHQIGKQHPKAALIRSCLSDNLWNPPFSQIGTIRYRHLPILRTREKHNQTYPLEMQGVPQSQASRHQDQ